MGKRHSRGLLVLTALFGPPLLASCFSSTPSRPARTDASGDSSTSLGASDGRTADAAIKDDVWTRPDSGVLSEDALPPSLDAPAGIDAAADVPQSSPDDACSLGTCTSKGDIGASCTKGSDCLLGNCVDGFCCESVCTGTCQACSFAKTGGADGRCRMVSAGTDPDSECSIDTGNQCGRDGTCDGLGACRLQILGTPCGKPSCSAGMLTPAGQCNGSGTCVPATAAAPCPGNLLCSSPTSCATTCTDRSTGGCPAGKKCVNGTTCTAASVACGGMSCPVANGGGGCCATDPNSTGATVLTCLGPTETCSTGSLIPCSSGSECPSGQICCAKGNNCVPGAWDLHCQADASDCHGSPYSWGYQVCDPKLSPTECLSGACEPSDCIPGVSVCSHN